MLRAWNKGKKMPHSPEWEANRIAAVRKAAVKRRGIKTGQKPTPKAVQALKDWHSQNPDGARAIAINNLPKDVNGSRNGNWKGGITAKTRGIRFSAEYKRWRQSVLKRDEFKCRCCGAVEALQVHHLIPISECALIATIRMNGITLCKKCHYEHDEAWKGKRFEKQTTGFCLIFSIPHKFQEYPTCGNWAIMGTGQVVVFVSDTTRWEFNAAIAVHELIEALLCARRGIHENMVTDFDIAFERKRAKGIVLDTSEPGDSPDAPYRREHFTATTIERQFIEAVGVDWNEYEKALNKL